jgi:RNA polymerase sigma-70 factor (ECF subfamily)
MDELDFRRAFREHKDSVYGFAYRMTGSAAAADDLTQECFLELLRRPECFDAARGSVRAFLLGVVRNRALKRWRAENRFASLEESGGDARTSSGLETAAAVAEAISALSPLQREVVLLIEYEGLTLEETAAATGCEVGTVKSRLFRARENLRRTLAPLGSMVRKS